MEHTSGESSLEVYKVGEAGMVLSVDIESALLGVCNDEEREAAVHQKVE